jgi:hypothetical protein
MEVAPAVVAVATPAKLLVVVALILVAPAVAVAVAVVTKAGEALLTQAPQAALTTQRATP